MATHTAENSKQVVEKAMAAIGDIATLPEITIKIIEIVESPDSTARDLHEVIKNDPALSVKILKVVNSAFYGLPGQVASVDRAIILLGLAAVKNIAIAASIARLFKGKRISQHFSAADLWRHNVAVAVTAKALAKSSPHPCMPDEVFVAGLIHDLGTLVERQAYPNEFAHVIDRCMTEDIDFLECEREVIGADHQAFGAALTTRWKFPRHLRAAVGFHHNPEVLSAELRGIGSLIRVADIMCCQQQFGFYLTSRNREVEPAHLEPLEITRDKAEEIRESLPGLVEEAEAVLNT
jgi:HD-like signal output (HDOD) protein